MRAVVSEVPGSWLEERARLGLDRFDEVWEGVVHMPPAPGQEHQPLGSKLLIFLGVILERCGVQVQYQTEVHRPGSGGSDYRIPDLVAFRDDQPGIAVISRGIEGGPLAVIEILSPDDETYEKFDFYAALGVAEIIVLQPLTREAEVYRLAGPRYLAVSPDDRGRVAAMSIDARFSTLPGDPPRLRVECGGEAREL